MPMIENSYETDLSHRKKKFFAESSLITFANNPILIKMQKEWRPTKLFLITIKSNIEVHHVNHHHSTFQIHQEMLYWKTLFRPAVCMYLMPLRLDFLANASNRSEENFYVFEMGMSRKAHAWMSWLGTVL